MVSLPRWLDPPPLDGGEEAERLRTAYAILLTGTAVLSASVVVSVLLRPLPLLAHLDYVSMLALHVVTLAALRRLPRRAVLVAFVAFYVVLSLLAMARSGIGLSPAGFVLPPIVLFAALTVGGREALVTAAFCSFGALLVVAAGERGWLPPPRRLPEARLWLVATGSLVITTYMIQVALRVIRVSRAKTAEEAATRRALEVEVERSRRMDAVGRLAAGAAHDFNNVLTVIFAEAGRLSRRGEPEARRSAEGILEAAERAAAITRQLLAFGRKRAVEATEASLDDIVRDLAGLLRRFVSDRIELELELEPALPRVLADRTEVEQILLNLVTNARDAMNGAGTVTVRVRRAQELQLRASRRLQGRQERFLALEVADTGTGMSEEVRARLFEPFFTTKEVGKGTGLGLSTVQELVVRAGGDVLVESAPGRGTTMTVLWPAL